MFYATLNAQIVVMGIVYNTGTKVVVMSYMVQGDEYFQVLFECWTDVPGVQFTRCESDA